MSSSPQSYTFPLALKRLENPARPAPDCRDLPEYLIQGAPGQNFGECLYERQTDNCERTFRAAATLGSRRYELELDSNDFAHGYDTLYFDSAGAGDLSGVEPIRALPEQPSQDPTCKSHTFPRMDLSIDIDGEPLDCSFFVTTNVYRRYGEIIGTAGLLPGAYREGDIELAGQRLHVVLVDRNANGRFNDASTIRALGGGDDALVVAIADGDDLYVGPDVRSACLHAIMRAAEQHTTWPSRLRRLGGRFWKFDASPGGETLTVSEAGVGIGRMCPKLTGRYSAEFHGPLGALTVHGIGGEPVDLPEGQWQLLSYYLDPTGWPTATRVPAGEAIPLGYSPRTLEPWRLFGTACPEALAQGIGTRACRLFEVRPGQTCDLAFGPPYRPVIKLEPDQTGSVRLELRLVGTGGEITWHLAVKGTYWGHSFTIASPDGQVVERGTFEYG